MVAVIKRISVSLGSLRQHRQAWVSGRRELRSRALEEITYTKTSHQPLWLQESNPFSYSSPESKH
jgi:hypothetical protein